MTRHTLLTAFLAVLALPALAAAPADLDFSATSEPVLADGGFCAAPQEMSSDSPIGEERPMRCTASAVCQNGTTVSCDAPGTCYSQDAACSPICGGTRGYARCGSIYRYCPPCPSCNTCNNCSSSSDCNACCATGYGYCQAGQCNCLF